MKKLTLLSITFLSISIQTLAQWTTGTNINNTNSGDVIIGSTPTPSKLKTYGRIETLSPKTNSPLAGEFLGTSGYWGFRTDIQNIFHFDIYNSNSPKSVLSINQEGQLFLNARKSNAPLAGELLGSAGYWGFRTDTQNTFHFDIYNSNSPKSVLSINQEGQLFLNARKSNTPLAGELLGSNGYWGFRTDTQNAFHLDIYNNNIPKSVFTVNQNGQAFFNARKSDQILDGEIFGSSGYWGFRTGTDNSFNLDLYSSGVPKNGMMIQQNGNVGIGTTDPKGYKLAINGKTITEEVVVKLYGSWPDYVLESDYKLPSLSELEQFIKINKHLPDVPTAAEVKENGLSVGEMNAILLKKVEELTLHLIEMKKEHDAFKKEMLKMHSK